MFCCSLAVMAEEVAGSRTNLEGIARRDELKRKYLSMSVDSTSVPKEFYGTILSYICQSAVMDLPQSSARSFAKLLFARYAPSGTFVMDFFC